MKERPILFSGPMVRGILDGRKTQTRRVVKHIPALGAPEDWCDFAISQPDDFTRLIGDYRRYCKHGVPNDLLWVRETFFELVDTDAMRPFDPPRYAYRATDDRECVLVDGDGSPEVNRDGSLKSPWKPSIHMPRRASRITLEIDSVRVERLQDISEDDAKAEGMDLIRREWSGGDSCADEMSGRELFEILWEHINGSGSWDANPYVWVIGFTRIARETINVKPIN